MRASLIHAGRRWGGLELLLWSLLAAAAASGQSAEHAPDIRVVMDDNYPPYAFKDAEGKLQGIVIDQWQLWERKTGLKVEIHGMAWGEALRRMKAGEYDVIDTVFETKERTAYFDFTQPYARVDVPIFFRRSISGITGLASLHGFPVAGKTGDAAVDLLREHNLGPLVLFDNYESIVSAAKDHKVNVFVIDKPPALYFLHRQGIAADFVMTEPLYVGEFRRAVRKGNAPLRTRIEQGFAAVTAEELARIEEKWHGKELNDPYYLRQIGYVALGVALLVALLAGWNWTLSRQVRKRTLALRQSESLLRESEDRMRSVLDGMYTLVALLSTEGVVLDCNRAPLSMMGRRREDLVGRPFASGDWFAHSSEMIELVGSMIRRAAEGQVVRQDLRLRVRSGEILDFDAIFSPLVDPKGQVRQIVVSGAEITQRKRAEADLRSSEERFRLFMDHSPTIAWVKDEEGRLVYRSRTYEERFGASAMPFQEGDRAVLSEGRAVVVTEEVRGEDGRTGYWLSSKFPFRDSSGRRFVAGIGLDVTERREAELVSNRLAAIVEYSDDAIVGKDPNGVITSWNQGAARLFGYTASEMVGASSLRMIPIDRQGEEHHMLAKIMRDEHEESFETVRQTRDGLRLDVSVTASPIKDALGQIIGCSTVMRDITGRKRSEERIRRLIESNMQGVIFWNMQGAITEANDAFLRIVGYTRDDLAAGRLNRVAMTPVEYEAADERARQELVAHGVCAAREKEYLRKDGTRVSVLIGAATFRDNPEEGVSFVVDLTERKKLEQQFHRVQRMDSIGTLAGGIAHDLNNVLSPIIMSIDLLRMKFLDAPSQELLSIMSVSAQRGADMVRQVLSFARGLEGRRMEVRMGDLVREIEKFANETFLKHLQVQTIVPDDLWTVLGDTTQLHQVLLNLCVNARDAMPQGGTLTIAARNVVLEAQDVALDPEARPGEHLLLTVEDSGTGIPPEVIERIFDPFFTTKEMGKGTGLGLSTSLGIVQSHGGFIRVDSAPGRGTKFEIYLPAQAAGRPKIG